MMLGMVKARLLWISGPTSIEMAKSRPRLGTARKAFAQVTSQRRAAGVPDPRPEGHGDQQADPDGDDGVEQVLAESGGTPSGPVQCSGSP